jgi:hypothetical protein
MIELGEDIPGSSVDPLCRWIPLPLQRMYRMVDSTRSRVIFIQTNSARLFESLTLLQHGDLHAEEVEADFCWDIVVEEGETIENPTSSEVIVLFTETMRTAYFGKKSFFAITPQYHYAAGFLDLPAGSDAKQELMEEYLTLLRQLSMDVLSDLGEDCSRIGMA